MSPETYFTQLRELLIDQESSEVLGLVSDRTSVLADVAPLTHKMMEEVGKTYPRLHLSLLERNDKGEIMRYPHADDALSADEMYLDEAESNPKLFSGAGQVPDHVGHGAALRDSLFN